MSGGGAAPVTTSSSTQTNQSPWAPAAPYIKQILRQAANIYAGGGEQYTPWSQVTGFTPQQSAAQSGILNYASGKGTQNFINQFQNATGSALGGGPLSYLQQIQQPTASALTGYLGNNNLASNAGVLNQMAYGDTSNPYLDAQVQGQLQNLSNQFLSSTLPGIRRGAIGGGTYSSSRNALSEGQAAAALDAQAQQMSNAAYMNDYQTQEANRLKALGDIANQQSFQASQAGNLLSGAASNWGNAVQSGLANYSNALNMPLDMLNQIYGVGTTQYNQAQNELADATARWNYQQQLPWKNLSNMKSVLDAYSGIGGSSSGATMTAQPSMPVSGLGTGIGSLLQMAPLAMGLFGGSSSGPSSYFTSQQLANGGSIVPSYTPIFGGQ